LQAKVTPACAISAIVLISFSACLGQGAASFTANRGHASASSGTRAAAEAQPGLAEIVRRLTEVQLLNRQSGHPYTVVREYELRSGKSSEPSDVTAEISVLPSGAKEYNIRSTQGGGSGERVVRRLLDHETEMASAWRQAALSEENYRFQLLGRESVDGEDCFVLGLSPRRDSRDLIRGRAWIDSSSFNVRRIQGTPAKSPSWWVKRLDINLEFSQLLGMWLQTAFTARAEVRLFGEHTLMGRDVQIRAAEASAPAMPQINGDQPPNSPEPNALDTSPAMVGAGVLSMPWHSRR
jgi:hypothetical protein